MTLVVTGARLGEPKILKNSGKINNLVKESLATHKKKAKSIFQARSSRPKLQRPSPHLLALKCAVPENIDAHPMEGKWKYVGLGVSKAKSFKGRYGALLRFPEGRGDLYFFSVRLFLAP